jgi:hypothetical protein
VANLALPDLANLDRAGESQVLKGNANARKLKLPENECGLYLASLAPREKAFSPTRNLTEQRIIPTLQRLPTTNLQSIKGPIIR